MKTKQEEICRCSLSGVQYSDYQLCVGIKADSKLKLYWERSNQYDNMAIRVEYCGIKIGYIPKGTFQNLLHEYRERGIKIVATIVSYNRNNPTWYMFTVKCEAKKKLNNSGDTDVSLD